MKKIFIGLAMLVLSSCYLKGDYTLGHRNVFNDFFYTYNIRYYDTSAMDTAVMETEMVSDYKLDVAQHAAPGGIVVSSKLMQKEVYSDAYVRPNKKGALVSYTVPVNLSDEKVYQAFGEVEIDGETYRLIKANLIDDIVLIGDHGQIYPRVGRIYNNRLALLDTSFVLEPHDMYFMNETKNRFGEENIVSGFEVRYKGVENYRMIFEYTYFAADGSYTSEDKKDYAFPMYDKDVSFEGIKLEILDASDTGLDYRVLEI